MFGEMAVEVGGDGVLRLVKQDFDSGISRRSGGAERQLRKGGGNPGESAGGYELTASRHAAPPGETGYTGIARGPNFNRGPAKGPICQIRLMWCCQFRVKKLTMREFTESDRANGALTNRALFGTSDPRPGRKFRH